MITTDDAITDRFRRHGLKSFEAQHFYVLHTSVPTIPFQTSLRENPLFTSRRLDQETNEDSPAFTTNSKSIVFFSTQNEIFSTTVQKNSNVRKIFASYDSYVDLYVNALLAGVTMVGSSYHPP